MRRRVGRLLGTSPPLRWAARLMVRLLAPRHYVGAVGAVFNESGQVLLVEHCLRTDYPWGLPGGWIERGENPRETVRREIEEELGLAVDVRQLVLTGLVGRVRTSTHPPHLGLAFYGRVRSGQIRLSREVLSVEWVDPHALQRALAPFQREAIELATRAFAQEAC